MGYYTTYNLELEKPIPNFKEILDKITYELWDGDDTFYSTNAKWYDWEIDMCQISKKYPDILFTLFGEGEEFDDLWKSYWLNGKWQFTKAGITFDKFDKNKLKDYTFDE